MRDLGTDSEPIKVIQEKKDSGNCDSEWVSECVRVRVRGEAGPCWDPHKRGLEMSLASTLPALELNNWSSPCSLSSERPLSQLPALENYPATYD